MKFEASINSLWSECLFLGKCFIGVTLNGNGTKYIETSYIDDEDVKKLETKTEQCWDISCN